MVLAHTCPHTGLVGHGFQVLFRLHPPSAVSPFCHFLQSTLHRHICHQKHGAGPRHAAWRACVAGGHFGPDLAGGRRLLPISPFIGLKRTARFGCCAPLTWTHTFQTHGPVLAVIPTRPVSSPHARLPVRCLEFMNRGGPRFPLRSGGAAEHRIDCIISARDCARRLPHARRLGAGGMTGISIASPNQSCPAFGVGGLTSRGSNAA